LMFSRLFGRASADLIMMTLRGSDQK
jgi:hypothetical protein